MHLSFVIKNQDYNDKMARLRSLENIDFKQNKLKQAREIKQESSAL